MTKKPVSETRLCLQNAVFLKLEFRASTADENHVSAFNFSSDREIKGEKNDEVEET
ncbi:hypothetical protein MTR_1g080000 [Medicago truncatula]|uniref:Uncharacterized protein n=1 Tax=Medicago truncatula TaxID=3880 RepID=G7I695_MEDTR|nr:hypothetical protein MTR_1g080000 [Medicago truncatula]